MRGSLRYSCDDNDVVVGGVVVAYLSNDDDSPAFYTESSLDHWPAISRSLLNFSG